MGEAYQGTDDWQDARLGKATASRVADIMARTKTGWGAMRANYAAELIAERLTGVRAEGFYSAAMAHGHEHEADARALYEETTGQEVYETGFIDHPEVEMSGASPDGLVASDGLVEIKCPNTATHIDTLLGAPIDGGHFKQMQWQMACTGRVWCDYVSYDPRLPAPIRLHVRRVPRNLTVILELEAEVAAFLAEVEDRTTRLLAIYPQAREAA
jgi:putative phage-type endonuclease